MLAATLALACAVFEAIKDLFAKRAAPASGPYTLAWAYHFFSLPIFLVAVLSEPLPQLSWLFWGAALATILLAAVAAILYMQALHISDISLSVPMVAFTPVFMLLTAPFITGETPSFAGFLGVMLIVVGAYCMRLDVRGAGILGPVRSILHDSGSRMMIIAAALWSITGSLDKIGVRDGSPAIWAFIVTLGVMLLLTKPMIAERKLLAAPPLKTLALVGIFGGTSILLQFQALTMMQASYVVAIKRISVVFAVVLGGVLLKERDLKVRLIASLVMVAGVALIMITAGG